MAIDSLPPTEPQPFKENPVFKNMEALRVLVRARGNPVKGCSDGLIEMSTSPKPTEGYTAITDTKPNGTFVTLLANKPFPENPRLRDSSVAMSFHPDGVIEVSVDPADVPEAQEFEEPPPDPKNPRRFFKTKHGSKIKIRCLVDNLGPNAQAFVLKQTTSVLEVFKELNMAARTIDPDL